MALYVASFLVTLSAVYTLVRGTRPSLITQLVFIFASLAALMLPASWRVNLTLASTSAYLTLLVGQLCLPMLTGFVVSPAIWLAHVLPDGPDLFPVSGLSRRLTVLCEEQPRRPVAYVSDPHGFRNEGGRKTIELAAIGDSFTQGACVENGHSFVDLLGRRYGDALNLGMSGDGPLLELATLKEYLPAPSPGSCLVLLSRE